MFNFEIQVGQSASVLTFFLFVVVSTLGFRSLKPSVSRVIRSYPSICKWKQVSAFPHSENHSFLAGTDDLTSHDQSKQGMKNAASILIGGIVVVAAITQLRNVDFNALMEASISKIESLGPYGYIYFAAIYIAAEILAIPAMPLTASSGYLFGLIPGLFTVLLSATIAACVSFGIGRFFLRDWAREKTAGRCRNVSSIVSCYDIFNCRFGKMAVNRQSHRQKWI